MNLCFFCDSVFKSFLSLLQLFTHGRHDCGAGKVGTQTELVFIRVAINRACPGKVGVQT